MASESNLPRGKEISEDKALEMLRSRVGYNVTQADLATEFGVSNAFMSAVLKGKKRMTEPMLASVGVRRRVAYFVYE